MTSIPTAIIPTAILDHCQQHGFTEPFLNEGKWYAFPSNGVIPVQLTWKTSLEAALRQAIRFHPEEPFRLALEAGHAIDFQALRQAFDEVQNQPYQIVSDHTQPNPPSY
ncbi:MAG: hypothetical protein AAFQ89_17915 [Cyanobacteria bacterium J06626_18]